MATRGKKKAAAVKVNAKTSPRVGKIAARWYRKLEKLSARTKVAFEELDSDVPEFMNFKDLGTVGELRSVLTSCMRQLEKKVVVGSKR